MRKILVIEDERRIAKLILEGLKEFGFDVSLAFDGEEALQLIKSHRFDLYITDIIMPYASGFELCKEIRAIYPNAPIIMLTALGNTDDKLEGFDAGADDYMVKPFDLRELNARINVLLKRKEVSINSPQAAFLKYEDLCLDLNTKTVAREGKDIKLTPKEFGLLKYMMENPERVLSRTEIAEKVWNTYFDTGTNFIDVYINYLRSKIDKQFDTKLIHTRTGIGFILIKEK